MVNHISRSFGGSPCRSCRCHFWTSCFSHCSQIRALQFSLHCCPTLGETFRSYFVLFTIWQNSSLGNIWQLFHYNLFNLLYDNWSIEICPINNLAIWAIRGRDKRQILCEEATGAEMRTRSRCYSNPGPRFSPFFCCTWKYTRKYTTKILVLEIFLKHEVHTCILFKIAFSGTFCCKKVTESGSWVAIQ